MSDISLNVLIEKAMQTKKTVIDDSYLVDANTPQKTPEIDQGQSAVVLPAEQNLVGAASGMGQPAIADGQPADTATAISGPVNANTPQIVSPANGPAQTQDFFSSSPILHPSQGGMELFSDSGTLSQDDIAATKIFQLKTEEYAFEMRADGLYSCPLDKQDTPFKRVCGSFNLTKLIDERGVHWGFLIGMGLAHILIPLAVVNQGGKKLAGLLGLNGFALSGAHSSMAMLRAYMLTNHQNIPTQFIVDRTGWVFLGGKWCYAHPSLIVSGSPLVVNDSVLEKPKIHAISGTLHEWQQTVGQACIGNFNFVFAICAALAGILLKFFGLPSIIFNFFGLSSKGKTTLLRVANSVFAWDDDDGVKSWRGTDNGLEAEMKRHNDGALALDEIFQCDIGSLDKMIYMVANGKAKKRFNDKAADTTPWRLNVVSSGELSAKTVLENSGRHYHGGMDARLLDIPIEGEGSCGVFHRLPSNITLPADFARYLNEMAHIYHGSVMQAVISHLVQNHHEALEEIKARRTAFIQEGGYLINDEIEGRVFQHFALIAAIGEYSIKLKILSWPQGHAIEAARYVFSVWQNHRRENALSIDDQIVACLMNAIQREGQSGFHLLSGGSAVGNLGNAYGYRKEYPAYLELILLADGFERLFGKWNSRDVCRVLELRNYLVRDGKNFTTKRAIPGNRAARCYVLRVQGTQ